MGSKKVDASDVARAACQMVQPDADIESTPSSVSYDRRRTGAAFALVNAVTNLSSVSRDRTTENRKQTTENYRKSREEDSHSTAWPQIKKLRVRTFAFFMLLGNLSCLLLEDIGSVGPIYFPLVLELQEDPCLGSLGRKRGRG